MTNVLTILLDVGGDTDRCLSLQRKRKREGDGMGEEEFKETRSLGSEVFL
ncbi:hypothetical protein AR1Y2_3297 [Anaerostipes rhamnosivorans]|uniref:Uncharacterized protein n=1 Tax=Anaerostipes rhamnosivorans TaxID=1229621 RepID=A0A4P8II82_9FIRM|nr:hypothetical protein AR1Y2_3297 [Anaerostipes rhamnosivorans]